MTAAHDVATVRAAEQELMSTVPPGTLMQRAAAGLAAVCSCLAGRVYGARVVVLAGSGDNGGDALFAGARLARRGASVTAVAAGPRIHPGGAAALRAAGGRVIGSQDTQVPVLLGQAGLVLDGLLGIGGRGGLRGAFADLADLLTSRRNTAAGPVVVAVDLPSGIDADTGVVEGTAIEADVTVTFGTCKPGLLIDPGAARAGRLEVIDIGLGPYLPPALASAPAARDVASLLPPPPPESDKYRRGVVGIVAGSDRFTGAAVLAVGGAVRGGAGMVRLVSAPAAVAVVRQRWPEAVITVTGQDGRDGDEVGAAGRVQAWVAGPGMGTDEAAQRRLSAVLATDLPVLVDADGLTLIAQGAVALARAAPTVLTPHAGELARLLREDPAEVAARRLEHARAAASRFGAAVLLKGSTTVIAAPGGRPVPDRSRAGSRSLAATARRGGPPVPGVAGPMDWNSPVLVNPTGTSWLATAGTGDVLAGLIGALLAQGLGTCEAASVAAYLHGLAAQRAVAGHLGGGGRPPATGGRPARWAAGTGPAGRMRGGGAPIGASDVVRALPGALRDVRRLRW